VDRSKVQIWESQFLRFMREQKPEVRKDIEKLKKLTPETTKLLELSIKEFGLQFRG